MFGAFEYMMRTARTPMVALFLFVILLLANLAPVSVISGVRQAAAQTLATSDTPVSSRVENRVQQLEQRQSPDQQDAPIPGASPPPPADAAPAQDTVLAAVVIEGARVLSPADLAPIYEPFLARRVSMEDIAAIAERITARFREEGYFLTRAFVPPQSLATGVVRIRVLEGSIEETEVVGSDHRAAVVGDHLGRIRAERPIRLGTLERSLLLIGDIPGLVVGDARLEELERATGRFKLTVDIERDRFDLFSSIDNRGDPDAGRTQLWTSGSVLGIGPVVDRLQVGVFTVPEAPRELMYGEVKATRLIGSDGVEIEARFSASESEPGPDGTETLSTDSESRRATATLSVPVYRRRDASYWGRFQLDARTVEDSQAGTPILTDHLRVGRAAIQGSTSLIGGNTWSRLEVSVGSSSFGASSEGTDRSRVDADGSFAKVNVELSHYRDLTDVVGIYGYVAGQYADDSLLSAEEFGVGGLPAGRGYEYSEISGEHGVAGLMELRYGRSVDASLLRFYQVYGFFDAGVVWNEGALEDPRDTLASTGIGLRLTMPSDIAIELEAARPLTRPVNGEGSRPWLGFVTLSKSF